MDALARPVEDSGQWLRDPARRVFVNRNLRMERIQWVGFDMDYTLAAYDRAEIEPLIFRRAAERLVEAHGYPEEVARLDYDPDFVVRGLVVDRRLGNIFKMDRHQHVGRVFHGTRRLTKDERRKQYRGQKIRLSAPRYHWIDTLFALPEAGLYAKLVDLYETQLGVDRVAYGKLFDDVRSANDEVHADGTLKRAMLEDLPRYLPRDPSVASTLHKLRSGGKRTFLLTNSEQSFTEAVMTHLLDGVSSDYPNWRAYFDFAVVDARKPGFFTGNEALMDVINHQPISRLATKGLYRGGSFRHIEQLLGDEGGEKVLYVGDHIYGDIIRSKKQGLWRTALVISELERELRTLDLVEDSSQALVRLEAQRTELDDVIASCKERMAQLAEGPERSAIRRRLEEAKGKLRRLVEQTRVLQQQIDSAFNPHWGSAFKEGSEVTRFGSQVEKFACVYTSRVGNLFGYSPAQYFRAPRHWMAHEKTLGPQDA